MKKEQEGEFLFFYQSLVRNKLKIAVIYAVIFVVAAGYIVFTTPLYTTSLKVVPASSSPASGVSSALAQFGGLVGIAGLPLSANTTTDNLEILGSQELMRQFAEANGILPVLFEDRWDARTKTWEPRRPGMLRRLRGIFISDGFGLDLIPPAPTTDEISEALEDYVSIRTDELTSVTTVSISWESPILADRLAKSYIDLANKKIRNKALLEAQANLDHLSREISKINDPEIRSSIVELMQEQIKQIMLAKQKSEFAFKVVDESYVPSIRSHPKVILIIAVALVGGGLAIMLGLLLMESWKRIRQPDSE